MKHITLALLLLSALASCNAGTGAAGTVKVANTAEESIPVYLASKGKLDHSVTEYRVVVGKSMGETGAQGAINSVQDQMKNAIGLGWQPFGGISITVDKDYRYTCTQAIVMIK